MTMIDVDTSPLQAAREWRGIGLVAAARASGLPMSQAEALEGGEADAFGSIDEMIAAAIVYGASIGIGRDEAVALLDRTVHGQGAVVQLPDSPAAGRPASTFSDAVQERSARIAGRATIGVPVGSEQDEAAVATGDLDDHPALNAALDTPIEPAMRMPSVPSGPTPEQAIAASGELELDAFGMEAPWERSGHTGELQAWAMDLDLDGGADVMDRGRAGGLQALLERIIGTERATALSRRFQGVARRGADATREGRARLQRSEHATLLVAVGAGAILIALVVALGGAFGGNDQPAGPAPAKRVEVNPEPAVSAAATSGATKEAGAEEAKPASATATDAPRPVLPPARLKVDVYNAGSVKGKAKQVAAKLEAAGYRIGEVTNAKSAYSGAAIIYPADMQREARVLARRTGVGTLQEAPGSSRSIIIVVA